MTGTTVIEIIGGVLALTQLGLIPFLVLIVREVRGLRVDTAEGTKSIVEMKIAIAEMKAADQLAASVAKRALERSDSTHEQCNDLKDYINRLIVRLTEQQVLKNSEELVPRRGRA